MKFRAIHILKAALAVAAAALLGWIVMLLWNGVAPAMFAEARSLDYLHALGLLILCRILFGGFRGRGGRAGHRQWQKWQAMTPEERAQFQRRGGRGCQTGESK